MKFALSIHEVCPHKSCNFMKYRAMVYRLFVVN